MQLCNCTAPSSDDTVNCHHCFKNSFCILYLILYSFVSVSLCNVQLQTFHCKGHFPTVLRLSQIILSVLRTDKVVEVLLTFIVTVYSLSLDQLHPTAKTTAEKIFVISLLVLLCCFKRELCISFSAAT